MSQSSITPQTAPPRLHFRVPPEPSHLLRARERLRDYLRQYCAERQVIDDVVLCVEEACTNAIRHSGAAPDIEISLQFDPERLVALVKDRGRGFDVASFDPHLLPDPLADHGRGLFIIAALMDSLELRLEGGLEVRMARRAEPRCEPSPLESGLGEPRAADGVGQREARTRALLEEIDEAFVALDWEYRYVYANERACRLLGRSRDELLGHTPFALFAKLLGSDLERGFRAAMELGNPTVMEWRSPVIGAWVEVRIYPTPAGISAYFHDISERKRTEDERDQYLAALRESEQRLRFHLENTPMAVVEWDAQFVVTRWAGEAERMFGWSEAETVGRPIMDLNMAYEADIPIVEATLGRLTDGVSHRDVSANRNVTKDGRVIDCTWYNSVRLGDDGAMASVMSLVLDNTERKQAELERERLVAELQDRSADLHERTASLAQRVALDESLERVNRLIYSTLEFDEIMRRALDEATEALGADAGSIEMREEGAWSVRYQRGFDAPSGGLRLSDAEAPIATRAALSREPLAVEDLLVETETGIAFLRGQQLRSTIAVPLIVRGTVVGCLLLHGRAPRIFTPPELDFARKLGSSVSLALENARLSEHETEAGRFDEAVTWSRTTQLVRRLRAHRWRVLVGAVLIESAILAALGTVGDTRRVLGVPGSTVALAAVIAGALAGPVVGALVAVASGVVFFMTVAGYGSRSSAWTTVISTVIWLAAGLVSGFLAKGLREQAERRRASSVALARADAARDAQLAEQSRIEELAHELQVQTEELQAQGEELQAETDDLAERAALAEALNAINALIHSTLDFDHVMQRAVEQGVDAIATDVGAIELREQESWIVRYQRGLSDDEIGRRLSDDEAPCATRAAASREPFTIADLTEHGSMNVGLVASCDLRSVVSVPLIVRKDVIGCLLFYDRRPRSFTETEVDFARKLGVAVSLAVANARLFEVEQAELARVTVLKEVATAAASSLEPARLSQNVLDSASLLLGATKGSVYLVDPDPDAGVARHVALLGYAAGSVPTLETLPLDDRTLGGRAILTGEVQAPEPGDVPQETVRRAQLAGMADDRLIAVPLIMRGTPVGSLGFGFPGRRAFRDHEIELCRAVAEQLGAALENARLFEAEVAAEQRASAELRNADLLLKSAKLLASGLDQRAILDTLTVVVLEALPHSRVTVQLWDSASRTLTIAASHGSQPATPGTEIDFDQTSPAFRDMLERKATVVTDFDAVPAAARGQAETYASRLHLGVPLVAGQELIGVLVVDDPGERRPFGEREIALLEAIAAQAATAIDNARVFARQQRIAQTLQENFIHPLPTVAGLELGVVAKTAYEPELVGGDFSDVFLIDDTHVVVLIADVAGKGVRAAGHTETVRSKVRAFATIDPSPAFILAKTNELLLRVDPDDPHVTAFLAVLDPGTGHLSYASAGHPAPVHLGAFSCRLLDVPFGPPLGSFERAYANAHAMLTIDDYLVLYTDGVTEARRGTELLGDERLREVVSGLRGRSAQEVADGVRDAALAFAGRLRDDLQVVVLRLA